MERPLNETGVGGGGNKSHWLTRRGGPSKGLFIELKFLADKLKCITSVSCCSAHWWVVDPV